MLATCNCISHDSLRIRKAHVRNKIEKPWNIMYYTDLQPSIERSTEKYIRICFLTVLNSIVKRFYVLNINWGQLNLIYY